LPCRTESTGSDSAIFIGAPLTKLALKELEPTSFFVLAVDIFSDAHIHHLNTTASITRVGSLDYNFCVVHERIERRINAIQLSLSSPALLSGIGCELKVLALLITLGARIALYNAAVVKVQRANFLGSATSECRKMGVTTANLLCQLLVQENLLGSKQVRRLD
jgi:hypothetical protein